MMPPKARFNKKDEEIQLDGNTNEDSGGGKKSPSAPAGLSKTDDVEGNKPKVLFVQLHK
jgi:hypothetical protein